MTKEDKIKHLKIVKEKINKDFGSGSVISLDDKPNLSDDSISSGSIRLDYALGIGGLPKGRVVEIFGPESSGKTTLATHIIAEAQKKGGICAYIDSEHCFDKVYAAALGVKTGEDDLVFNQPDTGEEALQIADELISSGAIDVVVIDSVAALVPKGELEGDMGDSKMGLHARLMSQALRKLTGTISKNNVLVIFINQLRDKIGVMFGNPETTTGGNALKFYASVRLDVRRSITKDNSIMDGDSKIGNQVTVKVIKNKVAPPFKEAKFDVLYGIGIDKAGELLDLAVEWGIIKKSGSWFSYKDTKLGQGRDSVKELLTDNPEIFKEIEFKIKNKLYS